MPEPTPVDIFMSKGKAQGKVEERVAAILELLEDNLGEASHATKDAVTKITDCDVLRRLTLLAAECKSPDEFNEALK